MGKLAPIETTQFDLKVAASRFGADVERHIQSYNSIVSSHFTLFLFLFLMFYFVLFVLFLIFEKDKSFVTEICILGSHAEFVGNSNS